MLIELIKVAGHLTGSLTYTLEAALSLFSSCQLYLNINTVSHDATPLLLAYALDCEPLLYDSAERQ